MSTKKSAVKAAGQEDYPIPDGHIPVMVTTEHRGVFFGYIDPVEAESQSSVLRLYRVRMCVYWTADVRGVLGLAHTGPISGCKITPANGKVRLSGVTGVFGCSPEAAEAWEGAPWAR